MVPRFSLALGLLLSVWTSRSVAIDKTRDPELDAELKTAATQLDKDALLSNNSDWLFDFTVSLEECTAYSSSADLT